MSRIPLDDHGQPPRGMNASRVARRTADELVGMAKAFCADGIINPFEAQTLSQWLDSNHHLAAEDYVLGQLANRISAMLEDGVIDAEERKELFELLTAYCGGQAPDNAHAASTTLPLDTPQPAINFPERQFCLTGKFAAGTRKFCQNIIVELGGVPQANVTMTTRYVVVGEIGSRDWKHSSYGTKILKAVEFREQRALRISIVSEEHWAKAAAMAFQP